MGMHGILGSVGGFIKRRGSWTANSGELDQYVPYLEAGWQMEASSGNEPDVVGSVDLTDQNGVGSYADAPIGLMRTFNGSNQYFLVTGANAAALQPTSGFVLSTWVYFTSDKSVFQWADSGAGNSKIECYDDGTLKFRVRQSDATLKQLDTGFSLSYSTLYHIVLMAENGFLRAYVDADEKGTALAFDDTYHTTNRQINLGAAYATYYTAGRQGATYMFLDFSFADGTAQDNFADGFYNSGAGSKYIP